MFSIFKKKKKKNLTFKFLCKNCDIFFYGNKTIGYCPCCGLMGEIYEVLEKDS